MKIRLKKISKGSKALKKLGSYSNVEAKVPEDGVIISIYGDSCYIRMSDIEKVQKSNEGKVIIAESWGKN